jgi:hypothetical protein
MRWGYELPREIAITGKTRLDLARQITADDLDGVSDVTVDPESLMPMPKSLRLFMLDNDLQRGLIPPDQYLRLRKWGWLDDVGNGDEDDRARANRIADLIRQGMPEQQLPPALPMDNAQVHMDVLRREILLDDSLPEPVRAVAFDRYMKYQQMQQQMTAPQPGTPEAAYQEALAAVQAQVVSAVNAVATKLIVGADGIVAPPSPAAQRPMAAPGKPMAGRPPKPPAPQNPKDAPLPGSNPSVSAGPIGLHPSEEMSAGRTADALSPL